MAAYDRVISVNAGAKSSTDVSDSPFTHGDFAEISGTRWGILATYVGVGLNPSHRADVEMSQ